MSKLLIVESPAKARTIGRFLGSEFKVAASMGHVRDLPTKQLAIDVEHDFEPTYVIPPKAKKTVSMLQSDLKNAECVYLATDPDREGEAIAWHLKEVLKPRVGVRRITFHEISKDAVAEAMRNARDIDLSLVDAQTARRVLDRLVGYTLSPFLWKKVASRLSAGRVQSVAVRLIVEREREIKNFKAVEYWSLIAELQRPKFPPDFKAALISVDGKTLERTGLKEKLAKNLEELLKKADFQVSSVEKKEIKRTPPPPFTTSTLQQEAIRKLGFSAKRAMTIAQHLYEDGLITYMRTDSVTISSGALQDARGLIKEMFGENYLPPRSRVYVNRSKNAQEAHEAVRPVKFNRVPDQLKTELDSASLRLYDLIWKRATASQMIEAKFERTTADIAAAPPRQALGETGNCIFRASGQRPIFAGYLKVYGLDHEDEDVDGLLPELESGNKLDLLNLLAEQHFTEPPPRYTEATLVKTLEELGIGRPSTYAPTMSVIQDRGYVVLEEKKFVPQDIGELVTDLLVEHFPEIIDYQFTAELEEKLDDIASGKRSKVEVLADFYNPYIAHLKQKEKELSKQDIAQEQTDQKCPKCEKPLVIKIGRFGKFYACSGYPGCDYTDKINGKTSKPQAEPQPTGKKCPTCGEELVRRVGRFGPFVGCGNFPKCKYIQQTVITIDVPCPKCGSPLTEKRTRKGRKFWGCSTYPKCDFATWNDPNSVPPSLEEYEANKAKKAKK